MERGGISSKKRKSVCCSAKTVTPNITEHATSTGLLIATGEGVDVGRAGRQTRPTVGSIGSGRHLGRCPIVLLRSRHEQDASADRRTEEPSSSASSA
jgi:hypothetical protein